MSRGFVRVIVDVSRLIFLEFEREEKRDSQFLLRIITTSFQSNLISTILKTMSHNSMFISWKCFYLYYSFLSCNVTSECIFFFCQKTSVKIKALLPRHVRFTRTFCQKNNFNADHTKRSRKI